MNNLEDVWSAVLTQLRQDETISGPAFDMWISCMEPQSIRGDEFVVMVRKTLQRDIIEQQYRKKIEPVIESVLGFPLKLKILCYDPAEEEAPAEYLTSQPVDEEYTFDNFIVGSSNKFAHAAAQAVASKPAYQYNPLFIYGGSGLGKTHLLHAICNEMLKKSPNANIVYVTGETFTNELIESVRSSSMPSFRMKYRDADVLLIDDVQFIGGKESTQEEFFHTFDFLYQAHRQIVLTSDRPPKEISSLADRLRSRFESGLLADIQPPDLETRIVIITRKAEQLDLYISPEVCEYIASQLKTNIRQLEGVVNKMRASYLLTGETPSLSSAQNAIRVVRSDMQPTPITIEKIIEEVARTMNVSPEDIRSQKSTAPISRARQTAVYVIREITGLSTDAIGKEFGGRDHSTIVYSYNKAKKMMETDVSYKHMVEDITKNIRSR